jgi:hypothetical protein
VACEFIALSFTNKIDHHDITEILLKVALNTITLTLLKQFNFHFADPGMTFKVVPYTSGKI